MNSPLVAFLRLPGINMMSHNRLVFATSFSILALAAIGLDTLWRAEWSGGGPGFRRAAGGTFFGASIGPDTAPTSVVGELRAVALGAH